MCHWLNGDGTEVFTHPDLPLSGVEFTSELGVGRLTGTLPPEVIHERTHDGYVIVKEWATAIYVYRDGRLLDAFIVADIIDKGNTVDIDCVGWLGYLSGLPTTKVRYLSYAPGILACSGLVADAMQNKGGDIGLRVKELARMPPVGFPSPENLKEAPKPYRFKAKGAVWTKARIRGGKNIRTRYDIINSGSVSFKGGSGYNKDEITRLSTYEISGMKGRWVTDPSQVGRAYPVPKKPVRPVYPKAKEFPKSMSNKQKEQIRSKYQRAANLYSKLEELWRKIEDDRRRETDEFKRSVKEIQDAVKAREKAHSDARWSAVWWETHDILAALDRLVKDAAFAMRVKHSQPDSSATGVMRVGHVLELHPLPFRRNTQAVLVEGENVLQRTKISASNDDSATAVMAIGAGEGAKMVRAIAESNAGGKHGLRRVGTVVDKTLRSTRTAAALANKHLRARKDLHTFSDVTLVDSELAQVGTFQVGDEVRYQTLDRRGLEVDEWVTILSIRHRPSEGVMVLRVKSLGEDYSVVPDYAETLRAVRAIEKKNPSKWNKQRPVTGVEREFAKIS